MNKTEEGRRLRRRTRRRTRRRGEGGGRSGQEKEDGYNGGHMPAGASRRRRVRRRRERGCALSGPEREREENNAMFLYHTIYRLSAGMADQYTPGGSSGM